MHIIYMYIVYVARGGVEPIQGFYHGILCLMH